MTGLRMHSAERVSGNEFQFGMKKKCRNKNKKRRHEFVAAMINDS